MLYRRNCDLCGKSVVTIYNPRSPYKVYCVSCWWSDKWSPRNFAKEIDLSKPLFEQFKELQLEVPRIALYSKNSVNSDYTNHAHDNKNCYLSVSTFNSENILYSTNVWRPSKECADCYLANLEGGAELSYECIDSSNIYNCQYSLLLKNCKDCTYCFDCRSCSDCFLSSNLRNKQYVYKNRQLSKDEYEKKLAEYDLGSFSVREKFYPEFLELVRSAIHRFANITKSNNVSGNVIAESKNAFYTFDSEKAEDSKYIICCVEAKDAMDCYHFGYGSELLYEIHSATHSSNVSFSHYFNESTDLQYCDSCHTSKHLFACVGMKNGEYMILNKAYEKEEYEKLKTALIIAMKERGEYGEFFPLSCSPFGYNETQAQVYHPIKKEEALAKGWNWCDSTGGTYGKETLAPEKMPDNIKNASDELLKKVLKCIDCSKNYNIVKPELAFYQRLSIPLPRRCPDCRYLKRLSLRLPRRTWQRSCMCDKDHPNHKGVCPNQFQTSYAPDRPEIVYCEQCYQAEVS